MDKFVITYHALQGQIVFTSPTLDKYPTGQEIKDNLPVEFRNMAVYAKIDKRTYL